MSVPLYQCQVGRYGVFSEAREVSVLRPKWASRSPSQGPAALEIDVKTGSEA